MLSSSWWKRDTELSFVARAVAGAASRSVEITVVAPMAPGATEADGAFDVVGIGGSATSGWPEPAVARWTRRPNPESTWIVDEPGADASALFQAFGDGAAFSIAPVSPETAGALRSLPLTPGPASGAAGTAAMLGVHVPVNPLAGSQRHMGLGFTGYILVLTDRPRTPPVEPPAEAVAWLTSRFHEQYLVIIEGGRAAVWKGRALRGVIGVDTRTDLWRLLAHARMTIDLAPGCIIARECIESLRLGTPIVVPEGTIGAAHARAGGGLAYADILDLLDHVTSVCDDSVRRDLAEKGRRYADTWYGQPSAFVEKLARSLGWVA